MHTLQLWRAYLLLISYRVTSFIPGCVSPLAMVSCYVKCGPFNIRLLNNNHSASGCLLNSQAKAVYSGQSGSTMSMALYSIVLSVIGYGAFPNVAIQQGNQPDRLGRSALTPGLLPKSVFRSLVARRDITCLAGNPSIDMLYFVRKGGWRQG